jgi:hypothetical protein
MKNLGEDAVELKEFINSTLDAIERGADPKHRSIVGSVEFEVSVNRVVKIGGNTKLYVFTGGGEKSNERLASVKFSISTKVSGGRVVKTKTR